MKIPFFPNTGDGTHCLQAVLMMALGYFFPDRKYTYEELDRISGKLPGKWTWPTRAMLWCFKEGLEVGLIEEFDYKDFADRGGEYLIERFGKEVGEAQIANSDIKSELEVARQFAKIAPLEYRVPEIDDIKKLLKEDSVVIVNLNAAALYNVDGYSGHFVVVCDVKKDSVILNDPGIPAKAGVSVTFERFNAAWAYPTTRDKNLMFIKRAH